MKDLLRPFIRHVCYEQIPNDDQFFKWDGGDDFFSASLQFNVKWFGRYYWHCFFLPWRGSK